MLRLGSMNGGFFSRIVKRVLKNRGLTEREAVSDLTTPESVRDPWIGTVENCSGLCSDRTE